MPLKWTQTDHDSWRAVGHDGVYVVAIDGNGRWAIRWYVMPPEGGVARDPEPMGSKATLEEAKAACDGLDAE